MGHAARILGESRNPKIRKLVEVSREKASILQVIAKSFPSAMPSREYPIAVPVSKEIRESMVREALKDERIKIALVSLGEDEQPDRLRAIADLRQAKAVSCLAGALTHNDIAVRIRSAKFLREFSDSFPGHFLMIIVEMNSVAVSGSENGRTHAIFQHALAETLNVLTGEHVSLATQKDSKGISIEVQDPEGLRRGIWRWSAAAKKKRGHWW